MVTIIFNVITVFAAALAIYNFINNKSTDDKIADVNAKLIATTTHFDSKKHQPRKKNYNRRYNKKPKKATS